MNTNLRNFRSLMHFSPELQGHISCEREFFLTDKTGKLTPGAPVFLREAKDPEHFSYELSACQVEYKTGPQKNVHTLIQAIEHLEMKCATIESSTGLSRKILEVAPDDMPRDIYPDKRYESFAANKTEQQLLSMLQVTACQFHVGMPDYKTARMTYNNLLRHVDDLTALCDHSNGRRMQLYQQAAPNFKPKKLGSLEDHFRQATEQGYVHDLKNCHNLIRVTRYGTIEFRMFGAASSLDEIRFLASTVLELCNITQKTPL